MEVRLMNEFHGRNFPKQLVSGSFRVPIRYTSFDIVTPLVVAAVPPELRRKMGLKPRTEDDSSDVYKAGAGVLAPAGSAPCERPDRQWRWETADPPTPPHPQKLLKVSPAPPMVAWLLYNFSTVGGDWAPSWPQAE